MRWWEARRQARSHHQAEALRNGAVQDLFALRQRLELLLMTPDPTQDGPEQGKTMLTMLDNLSAQLERTGDSLSPPFSEDDLSLALRQAIAQQLQSYYPKVTLDWNASRETVAALEVSTEQIRLLVAAVETVLELWLDPELKGESEESQEQSRSLCIHLNKIREKVQLQLTAMPWPQSIQTTEADKLCHAFRVLGGSCQYELQLQKITWTFSGSSGIRADPCLRHCR